LSMLKHLQGLTEANQLKFFIDVEDNNFQLVHFTTAINEKSIIV